MKQSEKICMVGLGYIGLPSAILFANHGHKVIGVDIDSRAVDRVNELRLNIQEPGLGELLEKAVKSGNLTAQLEPAAADVYIIVVPTPATTDKKADLSAVESATESIVPYLRPGNMVILESTVPPGTTRNLVVPIIEKSGLKAGEDIHVVHAPERVLPGKIIYELTSCDRVIGGIDDESSQRASRLYRSYVEGELHITDATTAELVKLMENTSRDVNIALANQFALLGELFQIDIWQAIGLANRHPRVNIMQPGPGVGGHCISVDPWFIIEQAPEETEFLAMARRLNDFMPEHVTAALMKLVDEALDPKIVVLGAAYKANVDDTRESPALEVAHLLRNAGCQVEVHDPHVYPERNLFELVRNADCVALLVDHQAYKDLDPELLGEFMRTRIVYDARNILDSEEWANAGFEVQTLGIGIESEPFSFRINVPQLAL